MNRKIGWFLVVVVTSAPWHLVVASDSSGAAKEDRRLAEAVVAILRADYRGDRAELERQARALSALPQRRHVTYREYWTGFAYWRRAVNGFNETPWPTDLMADLERGAARERAALALDASFEDARGALAGCLMGQMYLAGELPPERRAAVIREGVTILKALEEKAEGNPRSLWILGGNQAFAPPPYGGDSARATATYLRGLAAARREALSPARREAWVPSWGSPELLMSLSYLHTFDATPNRAVARAYAEGALSLVPDWHYVRDILIPRIENLAEPPPACGDPSP